VRRRLAISLLVSVALAVVVSALVLDGVTDDAQASDVGIVLGSKVLPDGRPSDRLRARLDKAADLYEQGLFKQVIVSGWTGEEGFSEAHVMADYLVDQRQIPRSAILIDEHGDTTRLTARNSAALMRAHGFSSAVAVTQYFHVTRSLLALRQAGEQNLTTAHASYVELRDFYSIARETVAAPWYWASAWLPSKG
jgi:vancomycin permeability regulator SanA